MDLPFPFEPIVVFAWLSVMLIVGIILRAKVGFFQRFLIPSCLIGGVLGLIIVNTGIIKVAVSNIEAFAYHMFNISFISVGLTAGTKNEEDEHHGKDTIKASAWMGLVEGVTFPLQAIFGGLLVMGFGLVGIKLFNTFGFLVPLGFTEGPGQALSFGKVWETHGFVHAAGIGLTFATIGFFFAFFVGVPLVNWGIRHGLAKHAPKELPRDFLTGITSKDQTCEPAGNQTMHCANVDTLAFQMAMVGLAYLLSYYFVVLLGKIFSPDIGKMLWGFLFFIGMMMGLLIRTVAAKLGVGHLIDPGIQRRITGWSVDYLMVATVTAIQVVVVWQYFWPIFIMGIGNGILTTLVVWYFGKRIWDYNLERTMAIYGTVTGTVSSGLLLLRIVDPDFKSPVALELGIMNIFAAPIILGGALLVNAPIIWHWSLGFSLVVFAALMLVCLILIKILKMWGPAKY
jgi:ESS family glutamate:Na+ symporter